MGDVGNVFETMADPADLQGRGTAKSIDAQIAAADKANATQKYIFDEQRKDLAPWREAGVKALGGMSDPSLSENFSLEKFEADPGYQFQLAEGNKAINNSAAARGMGNSGSAMKALTAYGQNLANTTYNDAYNRYNNDRSTQFNQLSTLAGLGSGANTQQVQAAGLYGNTVAGNQIGLGNAQAAAYQAQANSNKQMIGQGAGAAAMFSDERLKTDIEPIAHEDLAEMTSHLKAYAFNYKDDKHGKGRWVGVMAQDLLKSKLGKTLVETDSEGNLQINCNKVMGMFLATMGAA